MSTGRTWNAMVGVSFGCLAAFGCGGGSATPAASSSSGSEAASSPAATTPEALDARYREAAPHLVSAPVFEGPMAGLATEALGVLRTYSADRRQPETYLSLEVVSRDWIVSRNRQTGEVTGRHVDALTIGRFPDGRCLLYGASFVQGAVGDGFSDTLTTRGTGGGFPVDCATVDAITAARPSVAR